METNDKKESKSKEISVGSIFLLLFSVIQLSLLVCGFIINLWITSDVDNQLFWDIFYIVLFGSVAFINVYFLVWSKKSFGERLGFQLFVFTMFIIVYSMSTSYL